MTVGSTMTSRLAILAKVRRMRSALSFTLSFTAFEISNSPGSVLLPARLGVSTKPERHQIRLKLDLKYDSV